MWPPFPLRPTPCSCIVRPMPWDPARYKQFAAERAAPFEDLLALIDRREGMRVIDLGCGTGELTRRLAEALPHSDVTGIDSSAQMLDEAAKLKRPGLRFEQRRIEDVAGEWDLVFSHAAIHWLDDHESLIPRLFALVAPVGQISVQMPSNHDHPTHRLIAEIAGEEPFRTALGGWTRDVPVLTIDRYAELLYEARATNVTVLEKIYPHLLEDADALADWTSGTALVPYFERLDDGMRTGFMDRYGARLRQLFPQAPVFYPFRRILCAALRPGEN